ncbi:MAG: hypothetical protein ACM3TN_08875 [Alphaproteobacteria bacterium]
MPWVRKYPRSSRLSWSVGIAAGVVFGLLLGYERWGSTAAVVSIAEKELGKTEARITDLENRLIRLEAKLLSPESSPPAMEERGESLNAEGELARAHDNGASHPMPRAGDTY